MKYYLVATFNDDSYDNVDSIQKELLKQYKFFKNSIKPQLLLLTIEDANVSKLDELINSFLSPYKQFKVEINNTSALTNCNNSINLTIESRGYIKRFIRCLHTILTSNKFNVKFNQSNGELCIFLGNITQKGLSVKDIASNLNCHIDFETLKVAKIQLKKSLNNKADSIVKEYTLKEY